MGLSVTVHKKDAEPCCICGLRAMNMTVMTLIEGSPNVCDLCVAKALGVPNPRWSPKIRELGYDEYMQYPEDHDAV